MFQGIVLRARRSLYDLVIVTDELHMLASMIGLPPVYGIVEDRDAFHDPKVESPSSEVSPRETLNPETPLCCSASRRTRLVFVIDAADRHQFILNHDASLADVDSNAVFVASMLS